MTQMGLILGTAHMAPEQAKSRSVDARADVRAYGAVLFEMLSERRAFDGEQERGLLSRHTHATTLRVELRRGAQRLRAV